MHQLTDISSKHIFNLFLLKTSFDDELVITINGATKKLKFNIKLLVTNPCNTSITLYSIIL